MILLDKRVLLGIGIGMIIATVIIMALPRPAVSEQEILKMAKSRGMVYQDEVKALYNNSNAATK